MPIRTTRRFVKSLRPQIKVFGTLEHEGLSSAVAKMGLKKGLNALPLSGQLSFLGIAWEVVRDPMFLLLVVLSLPMLHEIFNFVPVSPL